MTPLARYLARASLTHDDLKDNVLTYLAAVGIEATDTDAARVWDKRGRVRRGRVKAGWPDLSCVLPGGRFLGVECKVGKDRLRPAQIRVLGRLEKAGALVIVARSVDDVVRRVAPWVARGRR